MGMLSEDRKEEGLAAALDVADNLTMSKLSPFGSAGFLSPARQRAATARWVSELDIKCAGPAQKAGELSGGNQQKIAMARLLHHDVDILVLDEPTRGIDVGSKAQIYRLIDALVADVPGRKPRAVLWSAVICRNFSGSATGSPSCAAAVLANRARRRRCRSTN